VFGHRRNLLANPTAAFDHRHNGAVKRSSYPPPDNGNESCKFEFDAQLSNLRGDSTSQNVARLTSRHAAL
jgi:hypothetical protein